MKTMIKNAAAGAVIALSAAGTLPVQAYDNDDKVYAGSECVRYYGAVGDNTTLNHSAIGNPSRTQDLRVDCPAINDEDGDGTLHQWFRAIDQNRFQSVRCNVNSIYRSGSSWWGWWTPWRGTSGYGSHVQHVNFPEDLGANSVSVYYFSCVIPRVDVGTSYITSYRVLED